MPRTPTGTTPAFTTPASSGTRPSGTTPSGPAPSNAPRSTAALPGSGPFQVVLDDVVRAPGGRPLLDGVRQSVALGERIGLVGENGTGKSTLLRLLAGLDRPDAGRLTVRAPGGVGHLPQTPGLPRTAPSRTPSTTPSPTCAAWRAPCGRPSRR